MHLELSEYFALIRSRGYMARLFYFFVSSALSFYLSKILISTKNRQVFIKTNLTFFQLIISLYKNNFGTELYAQPSDYLL